MSIRIRSIRELPNFLSKLFGQPCLPHHSYCLPLPLYLSIPDKNVETGLVDMLQLVNDMGLFHIEEKAT